MGQNSLKALKVTSILILLVTHHTIIYCTHQDSLNTQINNNSQQPTVQQYSFKYFKFFSLKMLCKLLSTTVSRSILLPANPSRRTLHLKLLESSKTSYHTTTSRNMPRIMDVDIYSDMDRPKHLIDGMHGGIEGAGVGGGFTVNNAEITGSIVCHADGVFLWNVTSIEEVSMKTLVAFRLMNPLPDILLIGSGETTNLPPLKQWKEIKNWAASNDIGVEIMDSASASSTFNILTQEDRNVVAALVAIDAHDRNAPRSLIPEGLEYAGRYEEDLLLEQSDDESKSPKQVE